MAIRKRRYVALTIDLEDVEKTLDCYGVDYELLAQSAYQVGIGFGAKVNVLLTFKLREQQVKERAA